MSNGIHKAVGAGIPYFLPFIYLMITCLQAAATEEIASVEDILEDNDFAPGLLIGAMVVIIAFLVCMGIGLAIGIVIILFIATATAIGIISTAALVGFYHKSLKSGFKAFILISAAIAGIPVGIVLLLSFQYKTGGSTTLYDILIPGGIGGITGGLLGGVLLYKCLGYGVKMLKRRKQFIA